MKFQLIYAQRGKTRFMHNNQTEEVIARASNGDLQAFRDIYDAYSGFVFNVALRVTRHREDAREITQEVFVTVHNKLKSFRYQSSLRTWMYRVTVNASLNYIKKHASLKSRTVAYDDALGSSYSRDYMAEKSEREHNEGVINRLLGVLTPEQRACIVLRSMEGLSYEEMADVLAIDVNAVRSRLKRAREKLLSVRKEVLENEL